MYVFSVYNAKSAFDIILYARSYMEKAFMFSRTRCVCSTLFIISFITRFSRIENIVLQYNDNVYTE